MPTQRKTPTRPRPKRASTSAAQPLSRRRQPAAGPRATTRRRKATARVKRRTSPSNLVLRGSLFPSPYEGVRFAARVPRQIRMMHQPDPRTCMFCDTVLRQRPGEPVNLAFMSHVDQTASCGERFEVWKAYMQTDYQGD